MSQWEAFRPLTSPTLCCSSMGSLSHTFYFIYFFTFIPFASIVLSDSLVMTALRVSHECSLCSYLSTNFWVNDSVELHCKCYEDND
jgi:hypothetical protein